MGYFAVITSFLLVMIIFYLFQSLALYINIWKCSVYRNITLQILQSQNDFVKKILHGLCIYNLSFLPKNCLISPYLICSLSPTKRIWVAFRKIVSSLKLYQTMTQPVSNRLVGNNTISFQWLTFTSTLC